MIVDGKRIGKLLGQVNRASMRELEKPTNGESVNQIMARVHRANMRSLDRNAPCEPITAAIVMEAYEEFLAGDFRTQMTEKYGIQYPLNMNVIDKSDLEKKDGKQISEDA